MTHEVARRLSISVQPVPKQDPEARKRNFDETYIGFDLNAAKIEASRCIQCPSAPCQEACPVNNDIPGAFALLEAGDILGAANKFRETSNLPEMCGRLCPQEKLCEGACVVGFAIRPGGQKEPPVTIGKLEAFCTDYQRQELGGYPMPRYLPEPSGRRVAVIGSGPAGMAAAQQLGRAGHDVHVYERESRPGGLMRYGIPDFKMEKHYIDRRIEQMQGEGVTFFCGVNIGVDKPMAELLADYDAVLYCGGSETPRAAGIPGDDLEGVHDAMPYLVQQNRRVGGEDIQSVAWPSQPILAGGQHVVVVGGGDTASDCVGTAFRQGAVRVTQLDIRPQPPEKEDKLSVWPYWATKMRTSSSQAEGAEREFQVATLEFIGEEGQLTGVKCCEVDEKRKPIPGTEFVIRADLAFIAIGFAGPLAAGVVSELEGRMQMATDSRRSRNVAANDRDYRTSMDRLFAAGDARRGQSLVVWAIREGRQAARAIDEALMGASVLPR
mgnify:CR=1 FL=1